MVPQAAVATAIPEGVWLIDDQVAVQIFDCNGLLCGKIRWLINSPDQAGVVDRDTNNPDPTLQQRALCGLMIFWGLRPTDPDHWAEGTFYNPNDGNTYRISAELRAGNLLTARVYRGIPFFGETKHLLPIPHGTSAGWC